MVLHGLVRESDRFGNNAADEAADFGRRRVSDAVIDARRNLSGVCGRWYPVILDLHRFFIACPQCTLHGQVQLLGLLPCLLSSGGGLAAGGRGRQAVSSAFRPGVGAHHTGDEPI